MSDLVRMSPLVRVLAVARAIKGRQSVSLNQLAEIHGCHPRTMRRWLIALERAGWPVPKWRTNPQYRGGVVN